MALGFVLCARWVSDLSGAQQKACPLKAWGLGSAGSAS